MLTVAPSTTARPPHSPTHTTATPSVTGTLPQVDVLRDGQQHTYRPGQRLADYLSLFRKRRPGLVSLGEPARPDNAVTVRWRSADCSMTARRRSA